MKRMSAGTYYIGDPCYIFEESWQDALNETEFFRKDKLFGKDIFVNSTAYGDGLFYDNHGNSYPVDAGMIGILPIELINKDAKISQEDIVKQKFGTVQTFTENFTCDYEDGEFRFGHIRINTKGIEDEEEWIDEE